MKDSLIQKLRAVLSDGIDSECKVVYLLAESRKLLDRHPPDPVPFALKLYCHWALHVDLYDPRHTFPFLKRVDEYVSSVLGGNANIMTEHEMLREFVYLGTFRQQFREFLAAYDLPTTICDEDPRWHEFQKHYAGVIEDGSLSCRAKTYPLSLIDEVVFSKGRAATSESHVPFELSWTIVLLDGRILTVDATSELLPDGSPMVSNVIRLDTSARQSVAASRAGHGSSI